MTDSSPISFIKKRSYDHVMIDYNYVLPVVYEEARETGAVVHDPGENFASPGQDQHEAGQERQVKT